jgi:hypothetical protein
MIQFRHSRSRMPAAPRNGTRVRQLGHILAASKSGSPQTPQGVRRDCRAVRRDAPVIDLVARISWAGGLGRVA